MRDLLEIRKDIDAVDHQIVDLYLRRLELAGQVAQSKIETGKHVYDAVREAEKLDALGRLATDSFSEKGIRELFTQVMSGSRKKQYAILAEHGRVANVGYSKVDAFDFQNAGIIYQGVEGAYAEVALETFFGKNHDIRSVKSWRDAFLELKEGRADYAVLPIENSTAGAVAENYDLMSEYSDSAAIIGEQIIPINHCLLGLPEAKLTDIKTVYSHPQALMQCSDYLRNQHPDIESRAVQNTAFSARKVKEDGDISQASIAGEINAKLYGLKVLDSCIQDEAVNETRFLILSRKHQYLESAKTLSLSFTLGNDMGSLYHILSNFAYNGLNLTRIESRPLQGRPWEYRFFVDCEGNLSDSAVENCLLGLVEETVSLQVLGNY